LPELQKSGQPPIFILMIARNFISAAAVSFSGLPPDSMSAVQHKRITHFASQSDNPTSLFLFFYIRCKLLFSRKAVVQIFHSNLLTSKFFRPAVLKILPLLLCKGLSPHDALQNFFAITRFPVSNVSIPGLCIIDNMSFKDLVLYHLFLCIFDGFH
jgi:hypothetical protein